MAVEKHYTTDQVRDLIGYAHVNDVYRLIKAGDLFARRRTRSDAGGRKTRKTKPHWIVPASALQRYFDGLETNRDRPAAAAPAVPAARPAPPPGPGPRRSAAPAMRGVTRFI